MINHENRQLKSNESPMMEDKLNLIAECIKKINTIKQNQNINHKLLKENKSSIENECNKMPESSCKSLTKESNSNKIDNIKRFISKKSAIHTPTASSNAEAQSCSLVIHLNESPTKDHFQKDTIDHMIDFVASQTKEIEKIQKNLQILIKNIEKLTTKNFLMSDYLKKRRLTNLSSFQLRAFKKSTSISCLNRNILPNIQTVVIPRQTRQ
jgi:uncharacterized coiled-coil protein SlyX